MGRGLGEEQRGGDRRSCLHIADARHRCLGVQWHPMGQVALPIEAAVAFVLGLQQMDRGVGRL